MPHCKCCDDRVQGALDLVDHQLYEMETELRDRDALIVSMVKQIAQRDARVAELEAQATKDHRHNVLAFKLLKKQSEEIRTLKRTG